MASLARRGFLFVLLFAAAFAVAQEEVPEPAPEPAYEFISGTIAELPAGKIVVNRAATGRAELRTFIITGETKIEGKLRTSARVTVGFKTSEEGEPVAVRIIVRPQNDKKH